MVVFKKIKRLIWFLLTPIWPYMRDFLTATNLIWHEKGRQRYYLGWLKPGVTPGEFKMHMKTKGFGNHFIAWIDENEEFSVRRLDGKSHQYHLRLFKDGNIRGHYEVTPEFDIYDHFWEKGMEARREEFLEFLGEWVIQEPSPKKPRDFLRKAYKKARYKLRI